MRPHDRQLDALPDVALLQCDDPDGALFSAFYRRHVRGLLRQLARQGLDATAAADVVAETFLTALLARQAFDPARGSAEAWLHGILRHRLADHGRQDRRWRQLHDRLKAQLSPLSDADVDGYEALRDAPEEAEALTGPDMHEALETLTTAQRSAVVARVVHEEPYAGIARTLETSEPNARQHVSRGLTALRRHLKG